MAPTRPTSAAALAAVFAPAATGATLGGGGGGALAAGTGTLIGVARGLPKSLAAASRASRALYFSSGASGGSSRFESSLGATVASACPGGKAPDSSATWLAGSHSAQPLRQTSVYEGSAPFERELASSHSSMAFCAPSASAQRHSAASSLTSSVPRSACR